MALAESMKNFVNDLKASRRSRHEFVKGNKKIAKNIMAENRKSLQNIQAQNKANAQQTRAFLESAKETRMENFKKSKEDIKASIGRVHQSTAAIQRGAREMIKEFREDVKMAHGYWASLATDEPIAGPKIDTTARKIDTTARMNVQKTEIKLKEEKREVGIESKKEAEKDEKSDTSKELKDQEERG
jgi:hypothetical protein